MLNSKPSPVTSFDSRTFAGPGFPHLYPGNRGVCYGQTGTGKTTLAEMLLREHQYVLALDTKANPPLAWRGYYTFRDFDEIERLGRAGQLPARVILEPPLWTQRLLESGREESREVSPIARMFHWVYGRGGMALYVDEVADVTPGPWWMPAGYEECLRKGRARGVTVLSSTQTPLSIPQKIMSQAEHAYIFYLKMPGERKKVEEMTGVPEEQIRALPKTYFLYDSQEAHATSWKPMRLSLGGVAG